MEPIVIQVVAGLLKRENMVLLASRPHGKSHAGSWEFPGGKLEAGETPIIALIRELNEEIGVSVIPSDCHEFTFIVQDYSISRIELNVMLVDKWVGDVVALENQELFWQDLTKPCLKSPLLVTTRKILDLF